MAMETQAAHPSSAQQPAAAGDAAPVGDGAAQAIKHEELRHAEQTAATQDGRPSTQEHVAAQPSGPHHQQQTPLPNGSTEYLVSGGWRHHLGLSSQHPGVQQLRGMHPETVSPGSTESSHYAHRPPLQMPMAESRQEEEFLMTFAPPRYVMGPPSTAHTGMGGGQPHTPLLPRGGEGMPMTQLMQRSMFPEDELAMQGAGAHGSHAGLVRGDPRAFGRMAAPPLHPGGGRSADGSPRLPQHLPKEHRDVGARPLGLQRAASEGGTRGTRMAGGHTRTRSGGRPPSERRAAAAAAQQPRNLSSPDFAMIYAFLGSMFDPVCHMINHADVLQQMTDVDRETAALILANCVHNLSTPGFTEELLAQLRAPKLRRQLAPGGGGGGFNPGEPQGPPPQLH